VIRTAAALAHQVIAVDDGSIDGTGRVLKALAAENGARVQVLSFERNRGKGTALLEAFRWALASFPFDLLITLDADGQHCAEDIPRFIAANREGADFVIGERARDESMPRRSRLGNSLTAFLVRRLYSNAPQDTQSGFRGMTHPFVEKVVRGIEGRRYETELEILLLAMEGGYRLATVPIPTIYLDRKRSSHFRPVLDSLRVGATLVGWALSRPLRERRVRPEPKHSGGPSRKRKGGPDVPAR